MKKFTLISISIIAFLGFTAAQTRDGFVLTDTQAAIDYMYVKGLTKFNTETTFMASASLRRDEAAAFFTRFARDVLGMIPDTSKTECNTFTDLSLGHTDLQAEMIASCQLGLFKGSSGKFMPTASFSNAHAVTVIVRLLNGDLEEPQNDHWASNYQSFAQTMLLTEGLPANYKEHLDKPIKRGEVARLIEAGSVYHEESIIMAEDIANVQYQEATQQNLIILLSNDKKSIITNQGQTLLEIDDQLIFDFFKTKSQLCDGYNLASNPGREGFCTDRSSFRAMTRFASILVSPNNNTVGFTIESDTLTPDTAIGILFPFQASNRVHFLTNYYLGNEFIGFSTDSQKLTYKGDCREGDCNRYEINLTTLQVNTLHEAIR